MTIKVEPGIVKRSLSAHAAIGLVAGALLYIVSLTGTIAVLYPEMQRIEQRDAPEMSSISPEAVQRGIEAVLASEAGKPTTTHLYVHLPVNELPRATVTTDTQAVHLHSNGKIYGPEEIAWSDFLVQLHYTLNMPGLVGITIVGILGVMMLALALSGVIAHPRIFRDAFRLRARDGGGVGLADWHNRLSVWTLPFSVAIALTGAIIGLGSVTAFAIAANEYNGEIEAVYSPIFGEESKPDASPAPVPNVADTLRHMAAEYPDVRLTYAIVHDPLTKGQHVQIVGEHEKRLIFGEYYAFGADGSFHNAAGLADGALGRQAAASTYRVHFGNFGGLWVKLAYVLFGVVLTAICATGTYIWLGKRRRRGFEEPRLRAAWNGVIWGAPVALGITAAARVIIGNDAPFVWIFWLCWVGLIILITTAAKHGGSSHSVAVS